MDRTEQAPKRSIADRLKSAITEFRVIIGSEIAMDEVLTEIEAKKSRETPLEQFDLLKKVIVGANLGKPPAPGNPDEAGSDKFTAYTSWSLNRRSAAAFAELAPKLLQEGYGIFGLEAVCIAATRPQLEQTKRPLQWIGSASRAAGDQNGLVALDILLNPGRGLRQAEIVEAGAVTAQYAPDHVEAAMAFDYWAARNIIENAAEQSPSPDIRAVAETLTPIVVWQRYNYSPVEYGP